MTFKHTLFNLWLKPWCLPYILNSHCKLSTAHINMDTPQMVQHYLHHHTFLLTYSTFKFTAPHNNHPSIRDSCFTRLSLIFHNFTSSMFLDSVCLTPATNVLVQDPPYLTPRLLKYLLEVSLPPNLPFLKSTSTLQPTDLAKMQSDWLVSLPNSKPVNRSPTPPK